jgi:NCAIR mutase (PurE)-related protein
MDEASLTALLEDVAAGRVTPRAAAEQVQHLPFTQVDHFAMVDTHRDLRTGFPEVIFCAGKTDEQIAGIIRAMLPRQRCILATRMRAETAAYLEAAELAGTYHPSARIWTWRAGPAPEPVGHIAMCCAGTSDLPVLEEAVLTAQTMGSRVEMVCDVGVAGIHRLLRHADLLRQANVVVVVAGMEGALASVVGGLVSAPVIAVPTSIGYGASFGGLAPLLTMLNSCASGVSVVNIDNGFGGGYCAHLINARVSAGPRTGSDDGQTGDGQAGDGAR